MNCLRTLERWDHGFESHSGHRCLCAFILRFVLSCVSSGHATGWYPVQGVLPIVLRLRNWSETKRFTDAVCSKVGATGKRERETKQSRERDIFSSFQIQSNFVQDFKIFTKFHTVKFFALLLVRISVPILVCITNDSYMHQHISYVLFSFLPTFLHFPLCLLIYIFFFCSLLFYSGRCFFFSSYQCTSSEGSNTHRSPDAIYSLSV
jgi:hypothetical protein